MGNTLILIILQFTQEKHVHFKPTDGDKLEKNEDVKSKWSRVKKTRIKVGTNIHFSTRSVHVSPGNKALIILCIRSLTAGPKHNMHALYT